MYWQLLQFTVVVRNHFVHTSEETVSYAALDISVVLFFVEKLDHHSVSVAATNTNQLPVIQFFETGK